MTVDGVTAAAPSRQGFRMEPSVDPAPDHDAASLREENARLRTQRDAALALSRSRAAFLAATSHEIREPMGGVLGMARLLRDTPLDPEQRGYVDAMIDSAEALLTVINDVLDLSRVDAGRLELDETEFALVPFLDRFRAALEPRARAKGLELAVEVASGTPEVLRADPGRLRQILANLVGNGLKFTDAGRVVVRVAPGAAPAGRVGLSIEVEDTGPGIPAAALGRLFDAFGQAEARTARLFGGSGLGLMVAERLSRALGGRLAVASREGEGTRFTLKLALAAPWQPAGEDAGAGTTVASVAGAALLLVDPQDRTRTAAAALATGWGMAVRVALTGGQALALLDEAADRGAPFDIVVVDQTLPDTPGDALGRRIRDEPRYVRPGLVLLAASGMRGDAVRARGQGFAAYLRKPVEATTLLACLQALRARPPSAADGAEGAGLITVHTVSERQPPALDILAADDNPVNLRLLTIILERAGHRVSTARDGLEAVRALEARPFDLVLMDVQMPVLDGLGATARIRALADPTRAATPIVAVTANAMRGDDEACFAAGMDGYVTKPVSMASLGEAVERHGRGGNRGVRADPA